MTQSMSLNEILCAPSQTRTTVSTAFFVAESVDDESSIQRAQSPKPIENTMMDRNCPFASAENGFWKSPVRNVPSEPFSPEAVISATVFRFAPTAWRGFAIEGLRM